MMENNKRSIFPTQFCDVNTVLLDLMARIQAILGSQFVGLYLYGSLALGDFDSQTSDIDFVVATQSDLSTELVSVMQAMHAEFDRSGSPWSRKIEAAYLPLAAFKHPSPVNAQYPQVERGTPLFLAPLELGWAFQRYTLRERGVIVSGPNPASFTDPVDQTEMQQAAAALLGDWQAKARQDPDWIAWLRKRDAQAFVVLTICRLIYSLETGSVVSKPAAARWAQTNQNPSRRTLIERALINQHIEQEISYLELQETLEFLDETLKRIQE